MSFFTRTHQRRATAEHRPAEDPPDASADAHEEDPDAEDGRDEAPDAAGDASGEAASGRRQALAWTVTALAAAVLLVALLLPTKVTSLRPAMFLRIPVEALVIGGLLLVLPGRAKRVLGVLAGVGIGLLTVLKLLDMGFNSVLGRPFDLLFDWSLIPDGMSAFRDSAGGTVAVLAAGAVVVLILGLLVVMPLAVLRVGGVMTRHTRATARTLLVLGVVWVVLSVVGARLPGNPYIATRNTAALAYRNVKQIHTDLRDQRVFEQAAAHDPYAATPPDRLLTALRGKNVIFAFVESYGRCAVQDPIIAPGVDAMLARETAKLRAAGYASRSAFLTSGTYGGQSWLGHSTFLSGLWINNQSRYRTVTHSSRMSLTAAFERTGAWRTVGIMPGTKKEFPEAKWEGLDHLYGTRALGYRGPEFSWSTMPDQYALSAFQRLENGRPHDKPLMSEIVLTSSHEPWAPLPATLPWNQVGDGSVYKAIERAGKNPRRIWNDTPQVRAEYGRSIQYSVSNLVDYVLTYGGNDTVLVFLGDHQPVPKVSGNHASHDVPVSIVAHDPDVMKRIAGWGWQDGLRPDPRTAPVWKMSAFRDRFLTAYGPSA